MKTDAILEYFHNKISDHPSSEEKDDLLKQEKDNDGSGKKNKEPVQEGNYTIHTVTMDDTLNSLAFQYYVKYRNSVPKAGTK